MGYVIMGSNGAHWGLSVLCILCSRSYKVREAIASRKSGSEGRRPKGTLFQNILIVYIKKFKIWWVEFCINIGCVTGKNDFPCLEVSVFLLCPPAPSPPVSCCRFLFIPVLGKGKGKGDVCCCCQTATVGTIFVNVDLHYLQRGRVIYHYK